MLSIFHDYTLIKIKNCWLFILEMADFLEFKHWLCEASEVEWESMIKNTR
jgi:hypothetical protein